VDECHVIAPRRLTPGANEHDKKNAYDYPDSNNDRAKMDFVHDVPSLNNRGCPLMLRNSSRANIKVVSEPMILNSGRSGAADRVSLSIQPPISINIVQGLWRQLITGPRSR
jgi:hypothetical protein